jgi:hypothetical protein
MAAADVVNVEMTARLVRARLDVDQACELLVTPASGSMDRCSQVLEAAVHRLAEACQQSGARKNSSGTGHESVVGEESVLGEAYRLQASVRRAGRLLEGANGFHLNWSRLRDAMTGGYTGSGHPAPVPRGSRISIRG